MTKEEINAAFSQMGPEERAYLKRIVHSDSPDAENEARTFVELFHHFPGSAFEEGVEKSTERVVQDLPPFTLPLFVRAEAQRAWEAWV
jgi:hypothetical protein